MKITTEISDWIENEINDELHQAYHHELEAENLKDLYTKWMETGRLPRRLKAILIDANMIAATKAKSKRSRK